MKIALLYTAWTGDDMDMLKRSIKRHSLHVDKVFVCFQSTSNTFNQHILPIEELNDIYDLDVGLLTFDPHKPLTTKQNERLKHDIMIQHAKKEGFTHFIMCACDHFYTPEQFEFAKEYHKKYDVDVSFSMMQTYYKQENWYVSPMEYYYMPFIHKMHPETKISYAIKYPVLVDPSVKVNTCFSHRVFTPDELLLHHYSMVRKDIDKKFKNAASSIRWTKEQVKTFISEYQNAKPGDSISYFQGRKIIEIK